MYYTYTYAIHTLEKIMLFDIESTILVPTYLIIRLKIIKFS